MSHGNTACGQDAGGLFGESRFEFVRAQVERICDLAEVAAECVDGFLARESFIETAQSRVLAIGDGRLQRGERESKYGSQSAENRQAFQVISLERSKKNC